MVLGSTGPSPAIEGGTTKAVLEAYVEPMLAPSLSPGRVAVMGDLAAHKGGRMRKLVEGRKSCEVQSLPAYSPDFAPIGAAFGRIEGLLLRSQGQHAAAYARRGDRSGAGRAVSKREARGRFAHCGYAAAQSS